MTYETTTTSSEATQQLGATLAKHLKGGETLELASDLGGGKTTLVQGLVWALGYEGSVTSPTFTLSNVYRVSDGLSVHHYDLYRLGESGVLGEELAEDIGQPNIITLIEWAGVANDRLPEDRLRLEIQVAGDTERTIKLTSGGPLSDRALKGVEDDTRA